MDVKSFCLFDRDYATKYDKSVSHVGNVDHSKVQGASMHFGSGRLRLSCTAGLGRGIADYSKPSGFSAGNCRFFLIRMKATIVAP
jgi:hypothetical protein